MAVALQETPVAGFVAPKLAMDQPQPTTEKISTTLPPEGWAALFHLKIVPIA